MAEPKIVSVMQAQLNKCTVAVRGLARQLGVNYAPWPDVRQAMTDGCLDPLELAEFLGSAAVIETIPMLGILRFRLSSSDEADRIESATVVIHPESHTIEIMSLRIKGDQNHG